MIEGDPKDTTVQAFSLLLRFCPRHTKYRRLLHLTFVTFSLLLPKVSRAQPPLSSLRAITNSPQVVAGQSIPVAFEATVTCCRDLKNYAYVRDGSFGIFVESSKPLGLRPGAHVHIHGLPRPVPATFDRLISGSLDARMVRVHGRVLSRLSLDFLGGHAVDLKLAIAGGDIGAHVDANSTADLEDITDCEVEASGIEITSFDGKMEQTGVVLMIPSTSNIRVVRETYAKNLSTPIIPFLDIVNYWKVTDRSKRVQVEGTVTYNSMRQAIVIQNGRHSIWAGTLKDTQAKVGDFVAITGFPTLEFGTPALKLGEIVRSSWSASVVPQAMGTRQRDGHHFDLISIEGTLLSESRDQLGETLTLSADDQILNATLSRALLSKGRALFPKFRNESRIRVTGICMPAWESSDAPCRVLMRSSDDVVLLAGPPLVNGRTLPRIAVALLVLICATCVWGWTLQRQVRQKARALARRIEVEAASQKRLAELEHRRRRIVEKINSNVP